MSVEFCDTNIIVYAYDATAGVKRERAALLLERLWKEGAGALSVQVLQELFVTLTRKIPLPLATPEAAESSRTSPAGTLSSPRLWTS